MKIEDQVCSLDQARELHELGVRCESLWSWKIDSQQVILSRKKLSSTQIVSDNIIPAYTCAELGVMLPDDDWFDSTNGLELIQGNNERGFYCDIFCSSRGGYGYAYISDRLETEAQARAAALIWLIKEGHIKAEEVEL